MEFHNLELNLAKKLLDEFNFQEASEILNKFEDVNTLSEDEQSEFFLLQSSLFYYLGEHTKSLTLANKVLEKTNTSGNEVVKIEAYIAKAKALLWFNEYDSFNENIFECQMLLDQVDKTHINVIGALRLKLVGLLSDYYWIIGDFDHLHNDAKEYLALCEKYGTKHDLSSAYLNMGLYFGETGDLDTAIENYEKSLVLSLEMNDVRSQRSASSAYNNIGENYRFKGELDLALSYYNKCLALSTKLNDKSGMSVSYHNIGLVYTEKGEKEKSILNLKKGLEINKEIGNNFEISRSLFDIICNQVDPFNIESLQPLLTELKIINESEINYRIHNRCKIAEALFLKNSGRARNIHKAEDILYALLEDTTVENELLISIILNLCDLLFKELQITSEQEILEEISPLIERLMEIAEKGTSFLLFAEFYYFKAKLNLLSLDLIGTQKYLTKAQQIAQKYSLNRVEKQISMEHDDLLKKLDIWKDLKEKNAPISERLKLISVENDLKILMKKEEIKTIDFHPEEPLFISIITKAGIALFTYSFTEEWKNQLLFSSFMTAFNYFSNEFFSKSMDRIKIGENIIIITPFSNLLFCYVIKGQTYPALKRLNRFLKEVRDSAEILEIINNALDRNMVLTSDDCPPLKKIIDLIFTKRTQQKK